MELAILDTSRDVDEVGKYGVYQMEEGRMSLWLKIFGRLLEAIEMIAQLDAWWIMVVEKSKKKDGNIGDMSFKGNLLEENV
ncbi:hypothetical protein Tco_0768461 [Tanacetum coccineum]